MNSHLISRGLLAVFCAIQGAATIALDLNRTHAAHPQWLGHARFHVVWQTGTVAALAIVGCSLLWLHGPLQPERFYLAALLALLPIFGFFAALFARGLYGGTLSDPGGIPPLRLTMGRRQLRIDLNLVAEIAGLITVLAIVALYRFGPAAQ
jgi:hypothetical protein